jgi:methyl coenzyme M reductase subunit D
MAATIDEKVAEVALAFQTEADARLCDRTAGVLKENVKMERKLKDINTQVMGVVDANDRLKKKVLVVVVWAQSPTALSPLFLPLVPRQHRHGPCALRAR